MNIIKYRYIFLSISGIFILAGIFAVAVFGLKIGVDFVGGTLWQIKLTNGDQPITVGEIRDFFDKDLGIKNAAVFPAENQSFLIRLGHISEEEHQLFRDKLKDKLGEAEELRYEAVGPTIGRELRNKAVLAAIFVLLGISIYVAYAFRKVSYPVKSWKYGVITLITLFHDVIIPTGLLAFFGWRYGVEFDTKFVVALLVIMGFSVHDTIVVFDRIRENLLLNRGRAELSAIVNDSIVQTIGRSINTSLTLVLTLMALFLFGPASLKYFVLTIIIGTIVGIYSSIFVASPLLILKTEKK